MLLKGWCSGVEGIWLCLQLPPGGGNGQKQEELDLGGTGKLLCAAKGSTRICRDFPSSPIVRTRGSHCRGHGS